MLRNKGLNESYDSNNDVMYISIGPPRPSYCEEDEDYLVRRDFNNDEITGLTIIGFSKKQPNEVRRKIDYYLNSNEMELMEC